MLIFSGILVLSFATFLLGLAILIIARGQTAKRFLNLFASSATAHYVEQLLRLLVGAAIVISSPSMWLEPVFLLFGWIVVVTSLVLLILPWQWHHQFGKWAIPLVIRHLNIFAIGAFLLAVFIFFGMSRYLLT